MPEDKFLSPQERAAEARQKLREGILGHTDAAGKVHAGELARGLATLFAAPTNMNDGLVPPVKKPEEFSADDEAFRKYYNGLALEVAENKTDRAKEIRKKYEQQGFQKKFGSLPTMQDIETYENALAPAVEENSGTISFLGGSTILNAIVGFVQWLLSGFEGGMDGLFKLIGQRATNNIADDFTANLQKANVPEQTIGLLVPKVTEVMQAKLDPSKAKPEAEMTVQGVRQEADKLVAGVKVDAMIRDGVRDAMHKSGPDGKSPFARLMEEKSPTGMAGTYITGKTYNGGLGLNEAQAKEVERAVGSAYVEVAGHASSAKTEPSKLRESLKTALERHLKPLADRHGWGYGVVNDKALDKVVGMVMEKVDDKQLAGIRTAAQAVQAQQNIRRLSEVTARTPLPGGGNPLNVPGSPLVTPPSSPPPNVPNPGVGTAPGGP